MFTGGTAALSLNFGVIRGSKTYSEGLLIGSVSFSGSAMGYLGVIYVIFICTFGLVCLAWELGHDRGNVYIKGDSRGGRTDVHWDVRLVSRQIIFFFRLVSDDTQELFLSLFSVLMKAKRLGDDRCGNNQETLRIFRRLDSHDYAH